MNQGAALPLFFFFFFFFLFYIPLLALSGSLIKYIVSPYKPCLQRLNHTEVAITTTELFASKKRREKGTGKTKGELSRETPLQCVTLSLAGAGGGRRAPRRSSRRGDQSPKSAWDALQDPPLISRSPEGQLPCSGENPGTQTPRQGQCCSPVAGLLPALTTEHSSHPSQEGERCPDSDPGQTRHRFQRINGYHIFLWLQLARKGFSCP